MAFDLHQMLRRPLLDCALYVGELDEWFRGLRPHQEALELQNKGMLLIGRSMGWLLQQTSQRRSRPVEDCVCIALMNFVILITLNQQRGFVRMQPWMSKRLKDAMESTSPEEWRKYPLAELWVLVMANLRAEESLEDGWFLSKLHDACHARSIRSFDQLVEEVGKIAWLHSRLDRISNGLWERLGLAVSNPHRSHTQDLVSPMAQESAGQHDQHLDGSFLDPGTLGDMNYHDMWNQHQRSSSPSPVEPVEQQHHRPPPPPVEQGPHAGAHANANANVSLAGNPLVHNNNNNNNNPGRDQYAKELMSFFAAPGGWRRPWRAHTEELSVEPSRAPSLVPSGEAGSVSPEPLSSGSSMPPAQAFEPAPAPDLPTPAMELAVLIRDQSKDMGNEQALLTGKDRVMSDPAAYWAQQKQTSLPPEPRIMPVLQEQEYPRANLVTREEPRWSEMNTPVP